MKASIIIDPSTKDQENAPLSVALQVDPDTEADWVLLQLWLMNGGRILVGVLPPSALPEPTVDLPQPPKPTSFGAFGP